VTRSGGDARSGPPRLRSASVRPRCRRCRRIGGDARAGPAVRWPWLRGGIAARRAAAGRAGGGGAGAVALTDQVVAVLADGGGLPPGLPESAPRVAAAAGGPARPGQQQAEPEQRGAAELESGLNILLTGLAAELTPGRPDSPRRPDGPARGGATGGPADAPTLAVRGPS
jgi:hypothetical protein